jgi:hypothetical protein
MAWVQLVALLALLECFFFAYAVGKARETYQLKAPATTGNENFERYFRVQTEHDRADDPVPAVIVHRRRPIGLRNGSRRSARSTSSGA